jgi:hypothetical protein
MPGLSLIFGLSIVGSGAWVVALIAAAIALRRAGTSRGPFILLILAGVFLMGGHPFPAGTLAFGCFFLATAWLEFAPGRLPSASRLSRELNRGVVGSRGRSLTPWIRNALLWSLVALLVALVVGAIYQTIATEIDQREGFPGPGEMVDVASELVVTMNKAAGVFGPPLARTDISRVFDLYPSHPELPPL